MLISLDTLKAIIFILAYDTSLSYHRILYSVKKAASKNYFKTLSQFGEEYESLCNLLLEILSSEISPISLVENSKHKSEILSIATKIKNNEIKVNDLILILENSLEKYITDIYMKKVVDAYKSGSVSVKDIKQIIDQFYLDLQELEIESCSEISILPNSTPARYVIEDLSTQFLTKHRQSVPFLVNSVLEELESARLYLLMGRTGVGKSQFAVAQGAFAAKRGFNVVHITLENTFLETLLRYAGNILDRDINLMKAELKALDINSLSESVKELYLKMSKSLSGYLVIKEMPINSSPLEVQNYLNSLLRKNLKKPDLLIIDYIDLLALPYTKKTVEKKYIELSEITTIISKIAKDNDIVIFSPTQSNRASSAKGFSSDDSIENIGESWGKAQKADVVFILRSKPEGLYLYLGKSRISEANKEKRLVYDFSKSVIKESSDDVAIVSDDVFSQLFEDVEKEEKEE